MENELPVRIDALEMIKEAGWHALQATTPLMRSPSWPDPQRRCILSHTNVPGAMDGLELAQRASKCCCGSGRRLLPTSAVPPEGGNRDTGDFSDRRHVAFRYDLLPFHVWAKLGAGRRATLGANPILEVAEPAGVSSLVGWPRTRLFI